MTQIMKQTCTHDLYLFHFTQEFIQTLDFIHHSTNDFIDPKGMRKATVFGRMIDLIRRSHLMDTT